MDDIFIRYVPMEVTVPAVTSKDENGDYNIYVNCNVGYNAQQTGITHEMNHIKNGHFEDDKPISQIEKEADGIYDIAEEFTLRDYRLLAGFKYIDDAARYLNTDLGKYLLCEYGKINPKEDIEKYIFWFKRKIFENENKKAP